MLSASQVYHGEVLENNTRNYPVKPGSFGCEDKLYKNPIFIGRELLSTGCPPTSGCLRTPGTSISDATKENAMLSTYRNITIEYSPKQDVLQPDIVLNSISEGCQGDQESVQQYTSGGSIPNPADSMQHMQNSGHSNTSWTTKTCIVPENCVMNSESDWSPHKLRCPVWIVTHQKDGGDLKEYNSTPPVAEGTNLLEAKLSVSGQGLYGRLEVNRTGDAQEEWVFPPHGERSVSYGHLSEENEVPTTAYPGNLRDNRVFRTSLPGRASDMVHQDVSVHSMASDLPVSTGACLRCVGGYKVQKGVKIENGKIETNTSDLGCCSSKGSGGKQKAKLYRDMSNCTDGNVCSSGSIEIVTTAGVPSGPPLGSCHRYKNTSLDNNNHRDEILNTLSSADGRKSQTLKPVERPKEGPWNRREKQIVDMSQQRGEFKISEMISVSCGSWSQGSLQGDIKETAHHNALQRPKSQTRSFKLTATASGASMGPSVSKTRRKTRTPSRLTPACDSSTIECSHPITLNRDKCTDHKFNRPASGLNESRTTAAVCEPCLVGKPSCNLDEKATVIEKELQENDSIVQRLDTLDKQNAGPSMRNDSNQGANAHPASLGFMKCETNNGRLAQSITSSTSTGLYSRQHIIGVSDKINTSTRKRQYIDPENQLVMESTASRNTSRYCRRIKRPQRLIEQLMSTDETHTIHKGGEQDGSIRITSEGANYEDGDKLSAVSTMLGYSLNPDGSVSGPPPLGVGAKYHRMILPTTLTNQNSVRTLGKGSKMVIEIGNRDGICWDPQKIWRNQYASQQCKPASFKGRQHTAKPSEVKCPTVMANETHAQV